MSQKSKKTQQGFTILELLVVMAIIGILIAMGLRAFGIIREKSRDNRRKQDLQSITKALEMYYNDLGRYPLSSADGFIMGCGAAAQQGCLWGDPFINRTNGTLYMGEIPQDPSVGKRYFYQAVDGGAGFYLFAYLENDEDPRVAKDVSGEPSSFVSTSCIELESMWADNTCNYVIMSSNLTDQPAIVQ